MTRINLTASQTIISLFFLFLIGLSSSSFGIESTNDWDNSESKNQDDHKGSVPREDVEKKESQSISLTRVGEKHKIGIGTVQSRRLSKVYFEIKNNSGEALTPTAANRSCSCFSVEFPQGKWEPGEVRKGAIEIEATQTKAFGGTAEIVDDEKQQLFSLDIHGEVQPLVSAVPPVITISGLREEQSIEFEIRRNFDYVPMDDLQVSQSIPSIGKLDVLSVTEASIKCRLLVQRSDLFTEGILRDIPYVYFDLGWKSIPGKPLKTALADIGFPEGLTIPIDVLDIPKVTPKLVRLRKVDTTETRDCSFLVRHDGAKDSWKASFAREGESRIDCKLSWSRVNEHWSRLTVSANLSEGLLDRIRDYRLEIYSDESLRVHSATVFVD